MKKKQLRYFFIFIFLFMNFAYPKKRIEGYIKGVSFDVCNATEVHKKASENESAETRYIVSQFRYNLDSIIHFIEYQDMKPVVPITLLTLLDAGVIINETHVQNLLENNNYFIVFRKKPWISYGGLSSFKHNGKILGEYVFSSSKELRRYTGNITFKLGIVYKNQILNINLWLKEDNFEICKIFPDYFEKKDQFYLWKKDSYYFFSKFLKEIRSDKEKLPDTIAGFFDCCDLIVQSLKFE